MPISIQEFYWAPVHPPPVSIRSFRTKFHYDLYQLSIVISILFMKIDHVIYIFTLIGLNLKSLRGSLSTMSRCCHEHLVTLFKTSSTPLCLVISGVKMVYTPLNLVYVSMANL
jgi:hypothetical protein